MGTGVADSIGVGDGEESCVTEGSVQSTEVGNPVDSADCGGVSVAAVLADDHRLWWSLL